MVTLSVQPSLGGSGFDPQSISTQPLFSQRYVLERTLGQGGMGTVYRSYDRLTRQYVALKRVVLPSAPVQFTTTGSEQTLALALEFRTLAALRHPNIVSVMDYGFDAQQFPYYTMQLIEQARTITEVGTGQDTPGKVRLVVDMLQALVYLHRRGILHRDLKPSNVLVTPDGVVKVLDFGLAQSPGDTADMPQPTNEVVGTLAYMAPEMVLGDAASVASDLYAVGVIVYEVFAGRSLYAFQEVNSFIQQVLVQPPDLSPFPAEIAPIIGKLLAKQPDQRYASASEVIAALCAAANLPIPAESTLLRESFLQASTFVGRAHELDQLKAALDGAFSGRGSVWLVGGESGIGKSRLLEELRIRALVRGARVLRGDAVAEGGLPYQLWREVARRLTLKIVLSDLEASVLKTLVPDIALLLGRDVPDAPEMEGRAAQQRLTLTLLDAIKRRMQPESPLVLLLEDLQWAEESLHPLRQLLASLDRFPHLLVVATYRDDERPDLPQQLASIQLMKLPPLNTEAVANLAKSMLGEAGANPTLLNRLQRETEGNAFFMVETVRALAIHAGGLTAVNADTSPDELLTGGMRSILQRWIRRLPERFRPLLNQTAVAGRTLDPAILSQLTAKLETPIVLEDFLNAGADANLFEVVEETWRFRHDKLREAVIAELSGEQRQLLNGTVAQAIEAAYPENPAYYETLLKHWHAAGQPERELRYLMPVVSDLIGLRAEFAQAEALLNRGFALLPPDDARVPTLLNLHCELSMNRNDFANAEIWARQAMARAAQLGDIPNQAKSIYRLGAIAVQQGAFDEGRTYFEQSLALYQPLDDRKGIAWNLFGLGHAFLHQHGACAEAKSYFEQALTLFRELGDIRGTSSTLMSLTQFAIASGDQASALAYGEEALSQFDQLGDRRGSAVTTHLLGETAFYRKDDAAAMRYFVSSRERALAIGFTQVAVFSMIYLGQLAIKQGDLLTGQIYLTEGLALCRQLGEPNNISIILLRLSTVYAAQGEQETALAYASEGLELAISIKSAPVMLAILGTIALYRLTKMMHSPAQRALITGLAEAHRSTDVDTREQILELKTELLSVLPPQMLALFLTQSAGRDLETTARSILADSRR